MGSFILLVQTWTYRILNSLCIKATQYRVTSRDFGVCTLTFPLDSPLLLLQPTVVQKPSKRPRLEDVEGGASEHSSSVAARELEDSTTTEAVTGHLLWSLWRWYIELYWKRIISVWHAWQELKKARLSSQLLSICGREMRPSLSCSEETVDYYGWNFQYPFAFYMPDWRFLFSLTVFSKIHRDPNPINHLWLSSLLQNRKF